MAEGPGVIGYYTLSSYTINPSELPDDLVRELPRYPTLPGEELLLDASKRCFATTSEVGSLAIVVEAENKTAIRFYQSYGFIRFPDHEDKLFLLMPTIRALFEK